MNTTQLHSRRPQTIVRTLATTLPSAGAASQKPRIEFNILFIPAGYVFSIWGFIYLALIGILVKQTTYGPIVAACGMTIGAIALGAPAAHWRKPAAILEATK